MGCQGRPEGNHRRVHLWRKLTLVLRFRFICLYLTPAQWVRAEILGAFFNAVFLIALCVSIVLEAVSRFIEPPEINNPKLILIVGCAGLFSNLLGFFVLGGHGHTHQHDDGSQTLPPHGRTGLARGHDEEQANGNKPFEPGQGHDDGTVADYLPAAVVRRIVAGMDRSGIDSSDTVRRIRFGDESASRDTSDIGSGRPRTNSIGRDRRRSSKNGHSGFASIDDISIHPASFRQGIIAASKAVSASATEPPPHGDEDDYPVSRDQEPEASEESPLLGRSQETSGTTVGYSLTDSSGRRKSGCRRDSNTHLGHNHTLPKKAGIGSTTGHHHGDMGMNAMVLHVIGDALGNIGVIATALIIWLTNWPGKEYTDPAVSLLIAAIILNTSIPLTRATSRVLLQATPENISIAEIRQDIEALPGVVSCHHVHVWQLSDTKVVASMHLQVAFPINTHSGEKYMQLARRARKCLHGFGIHSATIQPEFFFDYKRVPDAGDATALNYDGTLDGPPADLCLIECADDCEEQGCCPGMDSLTKGESVRRASDSSRSQSSAERR